MIKVSVIIPVYNQEELIKKAIFSIPCRDDIEIIVIDDCSTDDTLSAVRHIQMTTDYNLIILHNDTNMGVGYTVNRGYDVATGQYMVLLGSDDYFYTNEFSYVVDNFLNGADLIYFNLVVNNGEVWHLTKENKDGYCGSVKFMLRKFVGDTRNPIVRHSEDLEFFKKLQEKKPIETFTDVNVKHYNFPRVNSLYWNKMKGKENDC